MPEITINCIKTNYEIFGEGTPFLVLHGWGSNIERWEKIAKIISGKGFRVVAVDLPGFGKSDVPPIGWGMGDYLLWLEEFLDCFLEFKENFYLLGHSFGGSLAMNYSVKHPKKIRKLFLVAAAGIRKKTFKKTVLSDIAKFANNFKNIPLYGFARKVFYKFFVQRTDYLTIKESMKDTYLKIIAQDFSDLVPKITAPTIIIWGDKDNLTLVEDGYYMQKNIKNSKLIVIPEADHYLNVKIPDVLSKEVLNNI